MSEKRPVRQALLPAVIEDEPVHEFYANLIGYKPKSYGQQPQHQLFDQLPSMTDGCTAIPPDSQKSDCPDSNTEFGKAYRSALASSSLTKLSLDGSNKGYQLLSRMGWKENEGGLGRNRQGTMVPVKTVLKNDKKGLGRGKGPKARVTHNPHPRLGTPQDNPVMTKAQRRRRARQDAEAEKVASKKARMMINSDLPEGYYAYLAWR